MPDACKQACEAQVPYLVQSHGLCPGRSHRGQLLLLQPMIRPGVCLCMCRCVREINSICWMFFMSMGLASMFHMLDNFASKNLQLRRLQECWCSVHLSILNPGRARGQGDGHVSSENIGRRIAIRRSGIDRDVNFAKKKPRALLK